MWMPYFCQPLEEHLFPWLGFSMAGWPAWAWRVLRSTYPRFDLHCFNHPKQASPVHMQILKLCHPFCISCNSFVFFLVLQLLFLWDSDTIPLLLVGHVAYLHIQFQISISISHSAFSFFLALTRKSLWWSCWDNLDTCKAFPLERGLRWGRTSFQM